MRIYVNNKIAFIDAGQMKDGQGKQAKMVACSDVPSMIDIAERSTSRRFKRIQKGEHYEITVECPGETARTYKLDAKPGQREKPFRIAPNTRVTVEAVAGSRKSENK